MTKDEALKLAMEAMEITGGFDVEINAIKEALAQPEQEPVAWKTDDVELYVREDKFGFYNIPLYTHPPQRTWVGLTRDEILEARWHNKSSYRFARVLEAKLKEKNSA